MRLILFSFLFFSSSAFAVVIPGGITPLPPQIGKSTFRCLNYPSVTGTVPCSFNDLILSQVQTQNLIVLSVAAFLFFVGFATAYKSNAVLRTGGDA